MKLYISIFCSNNRTVCCVPQTNKHCHVQIYIPAGCPAPQRVAFPKRNQIICKGRTLVRKRGGGVELHLLALKSLRYFEEQKTIPKAEKSMLPEVLIKCLETHNNLDSHINTIKIENLLLGLLNSICVT